jgi:hypothetical protein
MNCLRVEAPIHPYVLIRINLSGRNREFAIRGGIRMLSVNAVPVDDSETGRVELCLEESVALQPNLPSRLEIASGCVRVLLEGLQGFVLH